MRLTLSALPILALAAGLASLSAWSPPFPARTRTVGTSIVAGPLTPKAASRVLAYAWEPGVALVYRAHYTMTIPVPRAGNPTERLDDTSADRSPAISVSVGALLRLVPLQVAGEGARIGFLLEDVCASIDAPGHATQAAACDDLARRVSSPSFLRVTCRGEVLETELPARLSREERNMVRSVMAAMQCVLPASAASSWETRERDAMGEFVALYEVEPGSDPARVSIRKAKRYEASGETAAGPSPTITHMEGRTQIVFSASEGRVQEIDAEESFLLRQGEPAAPARTNVRFHLRFLGREPLTSPTRSTEALVSTRGIAFDETTRFEQKTPGPVSPRASCLPRWEQVIARVEASCEADQGGAVALSELAALLRARPTEALRAAEYVRGPARGRVDVCAGICAALACAGTNHCQEALLSIVAERSLPQNVRAAAVFSAAQVKACSPRLVAGLIDTVRATQEASDPVASMAFQALGVLAASRASQGDAAQADEIARAIESMAASSQEGSWRLAALWGIGNAGRPCNLRWVLRELGSTDSTIRVEALAALRRFPRAVVEPLLKEIAARDVSSEVRQRAARLLSAPRSVARPR